MIVVWYCPCVLCYHRVIILSASVLLWISLISVCDSICGGCVQLVNWCSDQGLLRVLSSVNGSCCWDWRWWWEGCKHCLCHLWSYSVGMLVLVIDSLNVCMATTELICTISAKHYVACFINYHICCTCGVQTLRWLGGGVVITLDLRL